MCMSLPEKIDGPITAYKIVTIYKGVPEKFPLFANARYLPYEEDHCFDTVTNYDKRKCYHAFENIADAKHMFDMTSGELMCDYNINPDYSWLQLWKVELYGSVFRETGDNIISGLVGGTGCRFIEKIA